MHNDYVYKDRKMMKWMPFNALLEQGDHVSTMLSNRNKLEMPVLSYDQQEELNYQLETAYVFKSEIIVTYFYKDAFHSVQGRITRTDIHNHLLFIDERSLHAQTITKIDIL